MKTEIYEALSADLPLEAVERASKEITRKGYDTTGYQYQYLVNRLNEVCGIGGWDFSWKILKEVQGKWRDGGDFWDITTEVTVILRLPGEDEKDKERWVGRTCVGGNRANNYADALKGAITNGFKKTVAFFGLGRRAYEGTIDEDYRPWEKPTTAEVEAGKKKTQQDIVSAEDSSLRQALTEESNPLQPEPPSLQEMNFNDFLETNRIPKGSQSPFLMACVWKTKKPYTLWLPEDFGEALKLAKEYKAGKLTIAQDEDEKGNYFFEGERPASQLPINERLQRAVMARVTSAKTRHDILKEASLFTTKEGKDKFLTWEDILAEPEGPKLIKWMEIALSKVELGEDRR